MAHSNANTRMIVVLVTAIVLAGLAIAYFSGVLRPTNETPPYDDIVSNVGMPPETDANGPAIAQFKAECVLNGRTYRGTVSLPSVMASPRDLKVVELKTSDDEMVRFAQADAECTYAP